MFPPPKPWHLCRERKKEPALPWAEKDSRYHSARAPLTHLTGRKTLKHWAKAYQSSASQGAFSVAVSMLTVGVRHLVMCFGSLKWHVN